MKIKSVVETPLHYLKTFRIDYQDKLGKDKQWELISRGDQKRLEKELRGERFSDGPMIVAWDEKKEHVVLVKEFRVVAGHEVYSFPAGLQDQGESTVDAAIREFKEETGLDLHPVGIDGPRYTSVGLSNERVSTVYGSYSGRFSTDYQESSESITPLLVDKKEALRLLEEEDVTIRTAYILRAFFQLPLYTETF